MIDPALVIRKITLIGPDLAEIARLAQKSIDDYLTDPYAEVLAERYLERVIGRMIDINFHLITEAGHPPPSDYYQSFVRLGELGILPREVATALASSTGLRNRIAHEYDAIDPAKVHDGLQSAARDIPEYLRRVQDYLKSLPGS
jgi:uncharacterized protein YutE (UPF0331/DUF86 family)